MLVGLDFDNTIAGYDRLFEALGRERGWLPAGFGGGKKAVRDHLWAMPDGDELWQELQAQAYGARMSEAALYDGVLAFLSECRAVGIPVCVVSHKTAHASKDPGGVDLPAAARRWMREQALFDYIPEAAVFFEPTRAEKLARIKSCGCTHFVDDLVEVFTEPGFPAGVERLLFCPEGAPPPGPYRVHRHWKAIADDLLRRVPA